SCPDVYLGAALAKALGNAVADAAGATDHQHRFAAEVEFVHSVFPLLPTRHITVKYYRVIIASDGSGRPGVLPHSFRGCISQGLTVQHRLQRTIEPAQSHQNQARRAPRGCAGRAPAVADQAPTAGRLNLTPRQSVAARHTPHVDSGYASQL